MKATIQHTQSKSRKERQRTAACERSYDRYTLGLASRAERRIDPDLRRAARVGAAGEVTASYRLAVAQQIIEEGNDD